MRKPKFYDVGQIDKTATYYITKSFFKGGHTHARRLTMTTITIHSIPQERADEFIELIMDPKVDGEIEYKIFDIIHRTDHVSLGLRFTKSTTRVNVESNHSGIFIEVLCTNGYLTGFNLDPGESTGVSIYND